MQTIPYFKKLALFLILIVTLGFVYWLDGAPAPRLLAAESPLPQPWPTLVVNYLAQLPVEPPASVPAPQVARVSFLFHSPLPPPTPIVDALPPTTAVQMSGEQGEEAWYRSLVSLTFAISDDFGAGYTEYKFDNAATWLDREYYYPAVVLAEEGVHTLEYRSLDTVRNTEAPQTTQIRIDRTPPQANEPLLDGNPLPNGWYNQPISIQFSGADALSGVAGVERLGDNAVWALSEPSTTLETTGQHTVAWRLVDKAGNRSTVQETAVMVDLTPPTTTHTLPALGANGWYSQPVTLALVAVDVGAGVFQTQYRLGNESSWRLYAAPVAFTSEGVQTVEYFATDRALNAEAVHSVNIALDLTAPALTVTANGAPPVEGWPAQALTVAATASDATSGVASLHYNLDESGWQAYAAPLPVPADQLHTLRFRAVDQAGNAATSQSFTLGVDQQPPTTTSALIPPPSQ